MRNIVILGSTGSVGRQALEVIDAHPDLFRVVGLVAGHNAAALDEQARAAGCSNVGLGEAAAVELARSDEADLVVNAIVGSAGLRASVAALEAGTTLALANKESLVAGGELCMSVARRTGAAIVPVDSEHAAVASCLAGRRDGVSKIVLTASGGPFRTRRDLSDVTPADALAHPTWSMGPKITIDSATLMNKGLEVIEAHHLFGVGYDQIDVVVHPRSLVHGMVTFDDGTILMNAAPPDMHIPIAAALAWPDASPWNAPALDFAEIGALEFEPVDHERFPALSLARRAGEAGGTAPAVLNAANEIAVAAFLDGNLAFTAIVEAVARVLDSHDVEDANDLEAILTADAWSRAETTQLLPEVATL
ncbi:MAG TPA: 1-deoxy-D-xylulose-5-phosphate reductoisomerase [Actinomycetota bacterium]|nr:1-deoxy-D-xylulose-5-phosphate reductoisomerase [Actinomycetota bacterium]